MTQTNQKQYIQRAIRRRWYDSKDDAKKAITHLINIAVIRTPTINDLLVHINNQPLSYGNDWGWSNLYWDILNVRYGVKTLRDRRTGKEHYILQLPPVERLTNTIKERANER